MKALILAAGLGTRLRPLTEKIPKCLVPIGGVPLLDYHLKSLMHCGVSDVVINTHYLADQVGEFVKDFIKKNTGIRVELSHEIELLGSVGTLKNNRLFFNNEDWFFVVYGDNLTNINYKKLSDYGKLKGGVGTVAVYLEKKPEQKGIVSFTEDNKIIKFIEKPKPEQVISNYANSGIYFCNHKIFDYFDGLNKIPLDFGHDLFPKILENNGDLFVYKMDEYLLDIGNYECLQKAQEDVKSLNF